MSTALRTYYRGDELIGLRDGQAQQTRYYHFDYQGTTQCLTDQTGAVTDRFASDAWGVEVKRSGNSINRSWYVGGLDVQQTENTKLLVSPLRMYNPSSGYFLSRGGLLTSSPYAPLNNHPTQYWLQLLLTSTASATSQSTAAILATGAVPSKGFDCPNASPANVKESCDELCATAQSKIGTPGGGGLGFNLCYKGKRCACLVQTTVVWKQNDPPLPPVTRVYVPGDCEEIDNQIKKHELGHCNEGECKVTCVDIDINIPVERDDRIASECAKRKDDIAQLKAYIKGYKNPDPYCKEVAEAIVATDNRYVKKCCGKRPPQDC